MVGKKKTIFFLKNSCVLGFSRLFCVFLRCRHLLFFMGFPETNPDEHAVYRAVYYIYIGTMIILCENKPND